MTLDIPTDREEQVMNGIDVVKYLFVLAVAVGLLFHFGFMGLIGAVVLAHMVLERENSARWWSLPS